MRVANLRKEEKEFIEWFFELVAFYLVEQLEKKE